MASRRDSEYKMLNSPIKWVGGKSRLRKQIIDLIPPHTCYVEPFAGAAWVLFGKPSSNVEVLNDVDQDLINFFRVVKENPEGLIASFEWEMVSRAEFEHLASLDSSQLTSIQRAHRFYYLIMASWGGEFHYPRFQKSIDDGGHGNRLFGALQNLRKRVMPIYERLRTVIIENLDWQQCIDSYDDPRTVMYVDPPYPENGCNYVYNMRETDAHELLAQRLNRARCKWILSSYDKPYIRTLFEDRFIIPVQSISGMNSRKNGSTRVVNRELLITNFPLPNNQLITNLETQHALLELD